MNNSRKGQYQASPVNGPSFSKALKEAMANVDAAREAARPVTYAITKDGRAEFKAPEGQSYQFDVTIKPIYDVPEGKQPFTDAEVKHKGELLDRCNDRDGYSISAGVGEIIAEFLHDQPSVLKEQDHGKAQRS